MSKVSAATKTTTKGDKKDKSQLNNSQTESNGISVLPTKMHKIPQAKLQVSAVGRKPETTKTGSSSQSQAKSIQPPSVETFIPKPMAAIKGTTKKIDGEETFEKIKVTNGNESAKMQIVAPITMSPLHSHLLNQANNNMTECVHSASTINRPNANESSVIYRPAEAHGDIYQMQSQLNPIPNRKLDAFNDPMIINGNKFSTMSKVNGMVQVQAVLAKTIFEEDKDGSNVVPMRSLIRNGYNSCSNSPLRGTRISNGYYDENGQGYCSDGDALLNASIRYSDIENGYLSEGPHFLNILRNNRPQLPSTIAEERWVNEKFMTH